MLRKPLALTFALALAITLAGAQISNPKIYIAPADGFESYLAAGIAKQNVPAQIVTDAEQADYILRAAQVQESKESAGSKVAARCLFLYCGGVAGSKTANVQLVDAKTGAVVWDYNVRKGGSKHYRSSGLACAKQLKYWLEHPGN